jgi:protocatechuate 3,4-dioxygenase alpha subunit
VGRRLPACRRLKPSTGPTVTISGIVYDGDGNPINDAQIEAWLPDGRCACEAAALPGFRRLPSGEQTASFADAVDRGRALPANRLAYITVFARGLTKHQFTAVFLEDDPALAQSAILEQVPAQRRATLIARKTGAGHLSLGHPHAGRPKPRSSIIMNMFLLSEMP